MAKTFEAMEKEFNKIEPMVDAWDYDTSATKGSFDQFREMANNAVRDAVDQAVEARNAGKASSKTYADYKKIASVRAMYDYYKTNEKSAAQQYKKIVKIDNDVQKIDAKFREIYTTLRDEIKNRESKKLARLRIKTSKSVPDMKKLLARIEEKATDYDGLKGICRDMKSDMSQGFADFEAAFAAELAKTKVDRSAAADAEMTIGAKTVRAQKKYGREVRALHKDIGATADRIEAGLDAGITREILTQLRALQATYKQMNALKKIQSAVVAQLGRRKKLDKDGTVVLKDARDCLALIAASKARMDDCVRAVKQVQVAA